MIFLAGTTVLALLWIFSALSDLVALVYPLLIWAAIYAAFTELFIATFGAFLLNEFYLLTLRTCVFLMGVMTT